MSDSGWFCDAHRIWTTSDCPRCDDEQIALLDSDARALQDTQAEAGETGDDRE